MTHRETAPDDALEAPFQRAPDRRLIGYGVLLGALTYIISLVITLPAAIVITATSNVTVTGTLWHGQASLPGDHLIVWTTKPLVSIATVALAADWHLTGPDTDLVGNIRLRPTSTRIDDATGRASIALLRAFAPDLTMPCEGEARVSLKHLLLASGGFEADGSVLSAPSTCPTSTGGSTAIPPLLATLSAVKGILSATATTVGPSPVTLATAQLDPTGKLSAELRPEASKIIPGLPHSTGSFQIETTISLP